MVWIITALPRTEQRIAEDRYAKNISICESYIDFISKLLQQELFVKSWKLTNILKQT